MRVLPPTTACWRVGNGKLMVRIEARREVRRCRGYIEEQGGVSVLHPLPRALFLRQARNGAGPKLKTRQSNLYRLANVPRTISENSYSLTFMSEWGEHTCGRHWRKVGVERASLSGADRPGKEGSLNSDACGLINLFRDPRFSAQLPSRAHEVHLLPIRRSGECRRRKSRISVARRKEANFCKRTAPPIFASLSSDKAPVREMGFGSAAPHCRGRVRR